MFDEDSGWAIRGPISWGFKEFFNTLLAANSEW